MKAQNKGKYDLLKKEENRCIHWAAWLTGSVIQELPGYVWHLQHRCQQKKGKMWLETSVTKVRYSIECREYQASLVAQMAKTLPAMGRPGFSAWVGKIPWGREWLLMPVEFLGEFHRQRSLAGYCPWGLKVSDTTEQLSHTIFIISFLLLTLDFVGSSFSNCFRW